MATEKVRFYDSAGNTQIFDGEQATDDGQLQAFYTVQSGTKETAGSGIIQQIRPGLRFNKSWKMALGEAAYISFMRFITNGSDDYWVKFPTAPSLLADDSEAIETNDFRVSFTIAGVEMNADPEIIRFFTLTIQSVRLL
jgi:hypothetical protein